LGVRDAAEFCALMHQVHTGLVSISSQFIHLVTATATFHPESGSESRSTVIYSSLSAITPMMFGQCSFSQARWTSPKIMHTLNQWIKVT